ncbi:unnamed protein product [Withania somnifera]
MKSCSSFKTSRLSDNCGPEDSSEIISTLPKQEGLNPSFDYYQYKGFWIPLAYLQATLSMQENFKAQPSDIYICSSIKTGTTWLKALAFSIMTRHTFNDSTNPLFTKVPHECLPFLEIDYATNPKFLDTELPLLATHLPYTLLPQSILQQDSKIIYIYREPKDTFVSMWHFIRRIHEESYINNWFCEGKSAYGPYWDHVLGYWKASTERPERVLLFKYEDLKKETLCYVKKLADFMEKPFSMEEEARGVPEEIVARCNFKYLSNLQVNKSGWHRSESQTPLSNSLFFRKGETGDWKNLLTDPMQKSIDKITQKKFQILGLTVEN